MKIADFIAANGRHLERETGEHLFRQGDEVSSLFLVNRGLLKAYYLSGDGKENIKSFILQGDVIGSLASCHGGASCTFSLICLEPSELIRFSFTELSAAIRSDAELSAETVDFLLGFGMKKEMREYELLCLSAEERYRRLLQATPQLFERVTQNEIARYLGVTPVGLSRIKKRVLDRRA
ncbi:Crp/Fnr family transcriptional regulator [Hoeflea sp. EC-HK425]|uniref:Crp/Fnr family transcriptional regulator n=1 Tax=Hoeflea sp. EC-HK425 TaxID=2038388 RepID=UPI00125AD487|nr:Crp/Fnr family transcriptional regulator [Hoeflea sp. EC-HK425]VVT28751.1 cAMP-binding domain of CRP or a regulatory subunit of cAMP-dependent protein kinases [Hoeflea sp. EC-HK425]